MPRAQPIFSAAYIWHVEMKMLIALKESATATTRRSALSLTADTQHLKPTVTSAAGLSIIDIERYRPEALNGMTGTCRQTCTNTSNMFNGDIKGKISDEVFR